MTTAQPRQERAGLITRAYWVADTFRDVRWLARHLPITHTDVVLDVGSGPGPNLRSNVLCDKFPWDGSERHGHSIRLDRPFVMGDVECLPFADGAFDFAICSHVLEHVENPERAVAELERVARRGYIETPSASWEKLAGFDFHRWMVSRDGDRLVFVAKRDPIEDPPLSEWFVGMQEALSLRRYVWMRRRAAGVYTSLLWSGRIEIEVHRGPERAGSDFRAARLAPPGDRARSPAADDDALVREGPAARILARYGRYLRRHSNIGDADLERRLRCPGCHGQLESPATHSYRCLGCGAAYPCEGAPFPVLVAADGTVDDLRSADLRS
jgi:SAM-dependent methyltransferase